MNDLETTASELDAVQTSPVSIEETIETVETTDPITGENETTTVLTEAVTVEAQEEVESHESRRFHTMSKEELLNEVRAILAENRMEAHKEVAGMKQAFFNLKSKENLDALTAFVEAGNNPTEFTSEVDEVENEFKTLVSEFKEKRAAHLLAEEERRKANLEKKKEILARLEAITQEIDTVNVNFHEFKQLQAEFKEIKDIPATDETSIWKQFQVVVEQYYDHLKMNKELRDLDFRKNLEAKRALIEEAVKLQEMGDPIAAYRALKDLHDEWRNIGPVAKELRDSIWEEFKTASAVINRRHQDHFEQRKAEELANEEAKIRLCEDLEAINADEFTSSAAWTKATEEVISIQKQWREYGFASRKVNTVLYNRFREACDRFFANKTEYFQRTREELNTNLEKKKALCEKAEAMKAKAENGEGDARKDLPEIQKLQEEWKKIGSVPRKVSDSLWARFQGACNYFFELRKKENGERRQAENAALARKKEIIEALKALPKDGDSKEVIAEVKKLQADWNQAGFVPFKLKDKIYAEYREICDELYGAYETRNSRKRMNNFQERISNLKEEGQGLHRERERLVRAMDARKAELKTIENNMGFFNVKSSVGNSMLKDMERKIKRLKDDIKEIQDKIKMLDNEPKEK
ncbi:MAG: DUF349 domain-containing protein [Muribaculaceae bacterium]|nr:DUF349 domain-containing protein [Muribaculaceae bacterium]